MIIIEGSDCTGKTTLANELCEALHYEYAHLGKLPECWVSPRDYIRHICDHGLHCVYDRLHLSETIYNKALARIPRASDSSLRFVDLFTRTLGALEIVLIGDPEVIASRYQAQDEMFELATVQHVNRLYCEYVSAQPRYLRLTITGGAMLPPIETLLGYEIFKMYRRHQIELRHMYEQARDEIACIFRML